MKQRQYFSYNFLAVALIAFLNAPDRSDFNLPLSIFAFLLWNHRPHPHRHRILWLTLISILCDALWLLTISVAAWNESSQANDLRGLTQGLSLANLLYKGFIIGYAVVNVVDCKDMFELQAFKRQVLYQQEQSP